MQICPDNEDVQELLWSCLTFVGFVMENSLRALVQAKSVMLHSSLNPIKSRKGPNDCFYVFSVLAGLLLGVVGLQRGEVKRTNTFLFEIPLWSVHL